MVAGLAQRREAGLVRPFAGGDLIGRFLLDIGFERAPQIGISAPPLPESRPRHRLTP
jgi:hypothetical protein